MMTEIKVNPVEWEYKQVTIPRYQINLYKDCYENFEWIFLGETKLGGIVEQSPIIENEQEMIILKFKRDRRIENKNSFDRLQEQCETTLKEIRKLEGKKSAHKIGPLLLFGAIGAILLVFSGLLLFSGAYLKGSLWLFFSIISWGLAYFSHRKQEQHLDSATPKIQSRLDFLYQSYAKKSI